MSATTPGMFSSDRDDWRTPPDILAIAEKALGRIDLDPCAPEAGPGHVPARTHFTRADDGLAQPWHGRVFLNPPYGRAIPAWMKKAVEEVYAGRAEAVLALVAARPDTRWFQPLLRFPVAFLAPRVRFLDEHGNPGPSPSFPSALVLIRRGWTADDLDTFGAAVGSRGTIVIRWIPI